MNQQILKAYLTLIQKLLSCPRGEEWILLRQNEDLVNTELVSVMEQVANHLVSEGKVKEATYLHNWAGKLHHILTEAPPPSDNQAEKTDAYLKLIENLLNSPQSEHEQILATHHELIGPELVKVMKQVANHIAVEGDRQTAEFLEQLANKLNRTWLEKHEFEPNFNKETFPDPWLEQQSPSADTSIPEESVDHQHQTEENQLKETTKTNKQSSSPQPPIKTEEQITQQLKLIADSLVKLEATLVEKLQPPNPLWYMDILEKAETSHWILTTEEVEQLIGIKPHCHHHETSFHRGSWMFIKEGKVGSQIGWRVKKVV